MQNKKNMAPKYEEFNEKLSFECFNLIEKYKCTQCPHFRTNFLASLKHHLRDGHGKEDSEENVYKCLKCFLVTRSKFLIGRHILFGECATNDENERERRFRRYTIDQPECSFELKGEINFLGVINHRDKNSADKCGNINWFYCKECPYKCRQFQNLKRHIKFRHSKPEDIQWFECDQCPSKFKVKSALKTHIIAFHTKLRDIQWFECKLCSFKFKLKSNLQNHINARHTKPEDIRWYHCPHCPYKCKANGYLKPHIRLRHSKPEDVQWFNCEQCSYKSKQSGSIKRHFKSIHCKAEKKRLSGSEKKPKDIRSYDCSHCSYKAKRNVHLKAHIKLRHPTPEDIQWYNCPHCSYKFKASENLDKHIKWRHCKLEPKRKVHLKAHTEAPIKLSHVKSEGIQFHNCPHCSYKFKSNENLYSHIKWRHCKLENIHM